MMMIVMMLMMMILVIVMLIIGIVMLIIKCRCFVGNVIVRCLLMIMTVNDITLTFTTNIYEDRESHASPELFVHPIALALSYDRMMIVMTRLKIVMNDRLMVIVMMGMMIVTTIMIVITMIIMNNFFIKHTYPSLYLIPSQYF